jgi:hypothetical protein
MVLAGWSESIHDAFSDAASIAIIGLKPNAHS